MREQMNDIDQRLTGCEAYRDRFVEKEPGSAAPTKSKEEWLHIRRMIFELYDEKTVGNNLISNLKTLDRHKDHLHEPWCNADPNSLGGPGDNPVAEWCRWHRRLGTAGALINHVADVVNLALYEEHRIIWMDTVPLQEGEMGSPWPPSHVLVNGYLKPNIRAQSTNRGKPEWREAMENQGEIYHTYWDGAHDASTGWGPGEAALFAQAMEEERNPTGDGAASLLPHGAHLHPADRYRDDRPRREGGRRDNRWQDWRGDPYERRGVGDRRRRWDH